MVPSMTLTSEWHRPAALMATRTSPGPGSLTPTSSMLTGRSRPRKTAAFMRRRLRFLVTNSLRTTSHERRATPHSCRRVADAQDSPRTCAGPLTVLHDRLAVDHDAGDALGIDLPALFAAGQVMAD